MTVFFASHEITIRRNRLVTTVNGVGQYNLSATFTAYQADIQPQGSLASSRPLRREEGVGRVTSAYVAYVDATVPVKEGDQIDSGGYRYSVTGVAMFQGAGLLDHKELRLSREDANN